MKKSNKIYVVVCLDQGNGTSPDHVVNAFKNLDEAREEYPNNNYDFYPQTKEFESGDGEDDIPDQYEITEINLN